MTAMRDFWSARFVSQLGNELSVLAVPFLLIARSGSNGAIGFVYAAEYLPFLLLAPRVGTLVTRLGMTRTMVCADAARLLLMGGLAAGVVGVTGTGWAMTGFVLAVSILAGSASALDSAAYRALQPVLGAADGEAGVRAYARFELATTLASMFGPLLAGACVAALTPRGAIVLDAATFGVSALLVAKGAGRLRRRPEFAAFVEPSRERHSLLDFHKTAAIVRRPGLVRVILLGSSGATLASSAGYAVVILFAARTLGLNSTEVGAVFTCAGCGAVLGAIVSRKLEESDLKRHYSRSGLIAGVSTCAMPFAHAGVSGLVLIAAAQFVAGVFGSVNRVASIHLRHQVADDEARPHLEAVMGAAMYGLRAVGAAVGGLLAIAVGPRTALIVAVAGFLVAGAGVSLRLRTLASAAPSPSPAPKKAAQ